MSRAADDFEHLAGAYLGGASRIPLRAAAPRMPTLLVVGNVPTLAGIWIAHYVDQRARAEGPVALVRLDGAASRGELFRSQGRALPNDATAWMDRVSAVTRTLVLCVDSYAEPAAIAAAGCPIVLLTGTDEAALAAARRTIEGIDESARTSGMAHGKIGLALVGSAPDVAREAGERLVAWARERKSSIALAVVMIAQRVDRVEATQSVPLPMFSDLDAATAAELVELAIGASLSRFDATDGSVARPARHLAEPVPTPAPTVAPPVASSSSTSAAQPLVSAPASSTGASALITHFPELFGVPFECPDVPGIALAADTTGGLHLLAPQSASGSLRAARAWAKGNWRLLCAANPRLHEGNHRIIEHLILEDARDAVSLHRTGVLLHALVGVPGAARARVDLNDERSAGIE